MFVDASRWIRLAIVMFAGALTTSAIKAADSKTSTETGSKSGNVITNAPSFKPKQNGLKQLEQDLFRPFETIAPKGSLDGAYVPTMPEPQPNTPNVQSKRAKELLERRRDWAFETPEEILATSSDDTMNRRDKGKQSEDKSQLSPIERFYERLYSKDKQDSNRNGKKRDELSDSPKLGDLSNDREADDEADLPLGVRETQREMRKLLAPKDRKEGSSMEPRSAFSDVFGLAKKPATREEMEFQKERMDRYKQLLGLPVNPSMETDPLKPFRDMVGTAPKSPGLFPNVDSLGGLPQQNIFGAQSGAASLSRNSILLPDGAQIHTAPSLAPVLPKIEPPRTLPPPVTFNAPRRPF
jgi:hypothetical protein